MNLTRNANSPHYNTRNTGHKHKRAHNSTWPQVSFLSEVEKSIHPRPPRCQLQMLPNPAPIVYTVIRIQPEDGRVMDYTRAAQYLTFPEE